MSLSLQTQHRMADLFIVLYEGERQAEIMRQVLVEQKEFSPVTLFNHLAQGRENIGVKDLANFLDYHKLQFAMTELEQVLMQYGSNSDELTYQNFLNIILPSLASSLRSVKPGRVRQQQPISQHIECAFCKVLTQEVQLVRQLDMVREDLEQRWDFSEDQGYSLLESFSGRGSKKVDHLSLKRFFQSLSLCVTEDDILYLLRRADRDKDSKLGKGDFIAIIGGSRIPRKQSRLNTQRAGSKASIKATQSSTKPHPQKTQPSPQRSAQKAQRNNEALFRKISQLATHSPSKKSSRAHLATPDQSFSKRHISQFDPNSSNKKLDVPPTVSMSVSPHHQRKLPFESLEATTYRELPKHHGVDSRVINEDTSELVNVFVALIEHFQVVDQSRCQIVSFVDFSIEHMLRLFRDKSNVVTLSVFEMVANDIFGCEYSVNDIKIFFQATDLDRDGVLNDAEFRSIFEPTSEYYSNIMSKRGLEDHELHPTTVEAIKLLFDQTITMQAAYNEAKQQFFQRKRYSLLSLFEHLNQAKTGYLTSEDLLALFQRYHFNATQTEMEQLVKKFTRDRLVKTITMRQFLNELTPNH